MIKNHIQIFYTKFNRQLYEQVFNEYLSYLPVMLQRNTLKYRRWQDRHSHLFGKLLLLVGLKNYGYSDNILNKINYNQFSRPYIVGDIDFNISHSGEYVLCALNKNTRLGVDVEEIREVNFDDFKQVMTSEQWQEIMQSQDPTRSFFKNWTIKESVIKADSRGLSIPLLDIQVNNNKVVYDNQIWYLNEFDLNNRYCATLATNKQNVIVELKYIDFYKTDGWQMKYG